MITVVVLSLAGALAYGIGDFFGSVAARAKSVFASTTVNYVVAALLLAVVVLFTGGVWSPGAISAGLAGGAFGLVGFVAFFAALAAGPISIASPLIALVNSAVPVAAAVVLGEPLGPVAWIAIALAVAGSVLIGIERGERVNGISPRTIVFALVAGLGLGFAAVALDRAPADSGIIPVVLDAGLGAVVLGVIAGFAALLPPVKRALAFLDEPNEHGGVIEAATAVIDGDPSAAAPLERPRRRWLPLAIAAGALTGIANIFLMLGLLAGNVAVVAVLVNLYPLATMVLAWIVLRERLSALQAVGAFLAVVASVLLGTA